VGRAEAFRVVEVVEVVDRGGIREVTVGAVVVAVVERM